MTNLSVTKDRIVSTVEKDGKTSTITITADIVIQTSGEIGTKLTN